MVTGTNAIRQQLRNLQLSTRSEILWFCRAGHVAMTSSDSDEEFAMLATGVSYRVIYEQALGALGARLPKTLLRAVPDVTG